MGKRRSQKEELRKELGIVCHSQSATTYYSMNTQVKAFHVFKRTLHFEKSKFSFEEIEDVAQMAIYKIFADLYKKGQTIFSITAKVRSKEQILAEIFFYLKSANDFYDNTLLQIYINNVQSGPGSMKDQIIEMQSLKARSSIVDDLKGVTRFVNSINQMWENALDCLLTVAGIAFSSLKDYQPFTVSNDSFQKCVDATIDWYRMIAENYKKEGCKSDAVDAEFYQVSDNPYRSVYFFCLYRYLRHFYSFDIPKVSLYSFGSLTIPEDTENMLTKDTYSLYDVAKQYAKLTGSETDIKKIYDRMKKQFQKIPMLDSLKRGNRYQFPDPFLPLASYEYFRRKNRRANQIDFDWRIIVHLYSPLLQAIVHGEASKVSTYVQFVDFLVSNYHELLNSLTGYNHIYPTFLIEKLLESPAQLALSMIESCFTR